MKHMKHFSYRRSLIAAAIAACASAAYAQSECQQDIRQVEQTLQQQQLDPQLQTEVNDLLRSAEQNPTECHAYVARAEELIKNRSGQQTTMSPQTVQKASEVMGQTVRDAQGQEIGSIEDFALNMDDGQLAYVVLSTGGMLRSKNVGVSADLLQQATQGEGFVARIAAQDLQSAQALPEDNWPAQPSIGGQRGAVGTVEPASNVLGKTVTDHQGNQLGEIEDLALDMQQGKLAYVVLSTGGMLSGGDQKQVGVPANALQPSEDGFVANVSQQQIQNAQDLPDENWPQQPTVAVSSQSSGAGGVQQSAEIRGKTVMNTQGEELGRIEEFALDLAQDKLAYVAIRTTDGRQVGIPANMLREAPQGEGYVADISRQQLQNAHALPQQNWPDQPTLQASTTQSGSQSGSQTSSFSSLDQNQDGFISQDEAQASDLRVSQNFDQIDRNSDNQIDRSEFAAFEQQMQ